MVSIPLFVLLLATYAYSVPVGISDNISKQKNVSQPIVMQLIDDGESTPIPTSGRVTLTTGRNSVQITSPGSVVNNERAPREMMELSSAELSKQAVTWSNPAVDMNARAVTWSNQPLDMNARAVTWANQPLEMNAREINVAQPVLELGERGIEESSTLFPSTVETSTQFNQRKIRGQNVQSGKDLQTTEGPTSSVSSFATTTGLLRPLRGEQTEEQESTSSTMNEATTESSSNTEKMDEATTEVSATGRSKTVIEIIPGRNTKTEIIPGPNTKTEIIPGLNTKTEIFTNVPGRLVGGDRQLSQGKN